MEKITLLDTSVGSTNKGDEIIMKCVEEEMRYLLEQYYVLKVPTHLCSFNAMECLWKLPDSASEIFSSKYKFVCGTNLLSGNMFHRTNQWDINLLNCKPFKESILIGVGGLTNVADFYTKKLYQKILSPKYVHSVRDKKAYDLMCSMGLKCINTGCVTMWKLTPEFCEQIPVMKTNKVVFTLTDYKRDAERDTKMIQILRENYEEILFWIQGIHDLEYLQSLTDISDIKIIPPNVQAYENVLNMNVDYVGTRLHAGIFALRHKVRSIIISVDERMDALAEKITENCLLRKDIDKLHEKINSKIITECFLDWDAVKEWKEQFV